MLQKPRRINIFTGAFGSGKTELALNYAVKLLETGKKVTAVDLDLINPYFRIRSVREALETRGINVVSPRGKLAGADVPALPPAILGVLEDSSTYGVLDVGGDDIGAAALGRFRNNLVEGSFNLYFVVNTCRLHTRDVPGILSVMNRVEKASRLQINALISNPNLGPETVPGQFWRVTALFWKQPTSETTCCLPGCPQKPGEQVRKPGSAGISAGSDVEAALARRLSRL